MATSLRETRPHAHSGLAQDYMSLHTLTNITLRVGLHTKRTAPSSYTHSHIQGQAQTTPHAEQATHERVRTRKYTRIQKTNIDRDEMDRYSTSAVMPSAEGKASHSIGRGGIYSASTGYHRPGWNRNDGTQKYQPTDRRIKGRRERVGERLA